MEQENGLFKEFIHTFELNQSLNWKHPWNDPAGLSSQEREFVIPSIAQFQLGESSDGDGFLRRAAAFSEKTGDCSYSRAVNLFIAEEQNHSKLLGQFMERTGSECLQGHWVDWCFRTLRKMAGAETMVSTLVTAEIIACPYYRALRGATKSKLLKSICDQILFEEEVHLQFQAASIACINLAQTGSVSKRGEILRRALMEVAVRIVWLNHAAVFLAGNYNFAEFRAECLSRFDALNEEIKRRAKEFEHRLSYTSSEILKELDSVGGLLHA